MVFCDEGSCFAVRILCNVNLNFFCNFSVEVVCGGIWFYGIFSGFFFIIFILV